MPAKLTTAVSLIRKLIQTDLKVVVWTSFVHNIVMLMKLLRNVQPLPLYGGIPLTEQEGSEVNRERIIEQFCSDKSSKVLIANPAACGESISLHHASQNSIYIDRTFNCAHFLQSKDRIHRIGLDPRSKVTYHVLIGLGTVDEVVDRRLAAKERQMIDLLEKDFEQVSLDSPEDIVSEEAEEAIDFTETLKQLEQHFRDARLPQ